MDRQDKIAFLKGLQAGTRSIREILPADVVEFHQVAEDTDAYQRTPDGKVFTMAQLEDMQQAALLHNRFFSVYVHSDTPIAHSEEDITP